MCGGLCRTRQATDEVFVDWWGFRRLDVLYAWSLKWYQVYESGRPVGTFVPGRVRVVEMLPGQDFHTFWAPMGPRPGSGPTGIDEGDEPQSEEEDWGDAGSNAEEELDEEESSGEGPEGDEMDDEDSQCERLLQQKRT